MRLATRCLCNFIKKQPDLIPVASLITETASAMVFSKRFYLKTALASSPRLFGEDRKIKPKAAKQDSADA